MSDAIDLTFLAWTDTHFGYEPRDPAADIRYRAFGQMMSIAGTDYPPEIGGQVATPALIVHCGDFVDGRDDPRELELYLDCLAGAAVPSYETLGNHDDTNPAAVAYFVGRHGGRYYSFDRGGVQFISLDKPRGVYDNDLPAMDAAQLGWLEALFAEIGPDKPVVTFSHGRPDLMPNAADLDAVLARANVALMLSGHTHLQWVGTSACGYRWRGRAGAILGHVRNHYIDPAWGQVFAVVRIRDGEGVVAPWRWDLGTWARQQGRRRQGPEHLVFRP